METSIAQAGGLAMLAGFCKVGKSFRCNATFTNPVLAMSSPVEIARLIDHAMLHPTLTDEQIVAGCVLAKRLQVASVCVKPYAVPLAVKTLAGSGVRVGTVIGFPHGANVSEIKLLETRFACQQGAREIDMVVNVGKVLGGDWDYVEAEIQAIVNEAHSFGAITKVIFETDYVTSDETKIRLCQACAHAGAEYVKTSTGFGFVKQADGRMKSRGATDDDVRLMKLHAGPSMKVKASGGIRNYADAARLQALGAERLGTSATEIIVSEAADASGEEAY